MPKSVGRNDNLKFQWLRENTNGASVYTRNELYWFCSIAGEDNRAIHSLLTAEKLHQVFFNKSRILTKIQLLLIDLLPPFIEYVLFPIDA